MKRALLHAKAWRKRVLPQITIAQVPRSGHAAQGCVGGCHFEKIGGIWILAQCAHQAAVPCLPLLNEGFKLMLARELARDWHPIARTRQSPYQGTPLSQQIHAPHVVVLDLFCEM